MKSTWKRNLIWTATAVFIVGLVGTIATGFQYFTYDLISSKKQISVKQAEVVDVDISFARGIFHLTGGADQLMEAEFQYTENFHAPQVSYRENASKGTLLLNQETPTNWIKWGAKDKNEWTVRLNNGQPLHLDMKAGVGINHFQLGNLNLHSLKLDAGVGETEVDLRGEWQRSFHAEMEAGVGKLRLLLPTTETGVRVKVIRGIGDVSTTGLDRNGDYYQNITYETAKEKIDITIELGIGEVELIADE